MELGISLVKLEVVAGLNVGMGEIPLLGEGEKNFR